MERDAAADSNQTEVTAALVNPPCSATLDALLLKDTTAMYLAASKGFFGVVKVLLENPRLKSWEFQTTNLKAQVRTKLGRKP